MCKLLSWEYLAVFVIFCLTAFLRFYNLGYSDFLGDEHKSFISIGPGQNIISFFMEQRKGPMQFLVSYIPYLITGDFHNELAQRIPFALISALAVPVFYLMVKRMVGNVTVSLISAFLFSVNGFITGFGRISQYQNLNLLFSFLSIYYLYPLVTDRVASHKSIRHSPALGALFFSLSFLSHWDAVFIASVILFILIKFLLRPDVDHTQKITVLKYFIGVCVILILPFMIPYTYLYLINSANQAYFSRRVEPGIYNPSYFIFLIDLYNPYLTFWFLAVTGLIGVFRFKKSYLFLIWFLPAFIIFSTLFRKPGTHIYNFIIPWIIISSLGIEGVVKLFPRYFKVIPIAVLILFFSFFYYQTYKYFIDTSKEYPWEQKSLIEPGTGKIPSEKQVAKMKNGLEKSIYEFLTKKTPEYTVEQKLPLFGFPHRRYWDDINGYVNSENKKNGESFGYITNEDKVISDWYMDAKYRVNNGFYIIGIKRPTNFVQDWNFVQFSKKHNVKEFGGDSTVVRIYRVEKEDY